jgi:hypothetical protein
LVTIVFRFSSESPFIAAPELETQLFTRCSVCLLCLQHAITEQLLKHFIVFFTERLKVVFINYDTVLN